MSYEFVNFFEEQMLFRLPSSFFRKYIPFNKGSTMNSVTYKHSRQEVLKL